MNTLDGGRTYIPNILSNPYPNGISVPTGSSLGASTFVGRNNDWFNSDFVVPKVWSFSCGFQYQVTQASTRDISYVGSGAYCDQAVPNPFKGIPEFQGTAFYTSDTGIMRSPAMRR